MLEGALHFELSRVQRGLETLYRVETELDIADFLIDAETRAAAGLSRHSREQLILRQSGEVGVFICENALRNLALNDPSVRLDDSNFADFLLAVEGVSHFVYLAWMARGERPVSGLELELQAEVDKYVTLLLAEPEIAKGESRRLRRRLFHDFVYEPDLDATERGRYAAANASAAAYAAYLEDRYVATDRTADLLPDVRRFYRSSLSDKLSRG